MCISPFYDEVSKNVVKKITDKYSNCYYIELKENPFVFLSNSGQGSNMIMHPKEGDVTHYGKVGYLNFAKCLLEQTCIIINDNLKDFN